MKRWPIIKLFIKDFLKECGDKHLLILSSSTCFFFFLCLIPSTLLLISFATFAFESLVPEETFNLINYVESVIPKDILPSVQLILKHSKSMLNTNKNLNTLHYIILLFSSLGFFGSVWRSVDIITGVKAHGTLLRTLYNFLSITIAFVFFLLMAFLPILGKLIDIFLQSEYLKFFKFTELLTDGFMQMELLGVNFFSTLLLFIFFILFFKFLLKANSNFRATAIGSTFFTVQILITKNIFLTYLSLAKESLLINYGSLYSIMIFVIWAFAVILAFYDSIIFTYALSRHRYKLRIKDIV